MKLKFNRNYLDFEKGKTYDVKPPASKYIIAMRIAKEVVKKDGSSLDEEKAKAEADRVKAEQEAEAERLRLEQEEADKLKQEPPVTDIPTLHSKEATIERNQADKIISGQTPEDDAATADPIKLTHKEPIKVTEKATTKPATKKADVKPANNADDPDDLLGLFS